MAACKLNIKVHRKWLGKQSIINSMPRWSSTIFLIKNAICRNHLFRNTKNIYSPQNSKKQKKKTKNIISYNPRLKLPHERLSSPCSSMCFFGHMYSLWNSCANLEWNCLTYIHEQYCLGLPLGGGTGCHVPLLSQERQNCSTSVCSGVSILSTTWKQGIMLSLLG